MKYNSSGRKGIVNIENEVLKLYDSGVIIKNICSELNICWATVRNYLRKHNRRRQIVHTFDDNSFSSFTAESCYWAGFIGADGGIDKENRCVMLNLKLSDRHHLEKLLKFVKDENATVKEHLGVNCYTTINSKQIVKNLNDSFNITPVKSFTLQPPLKVPKELIKSYIRGYFDGDGCIAWNTSSNRVSFDISSGSFDLLSWISNNIKNLVDFDFSEKSLTVRKAETIYRIGTSGKPAKAIFDWLYSDSTPDARLDRKYERYLKYYNLA